MLRVTRPFVGYGYNMPAPGTLIDPPEPQRTEILALRVAVEYEAKIQPTPQEIKKKPAPLESSHPALVQPQRTRNGLRRFLTKLLR